ncbi:hypothetical protein Rsub_13245 [Raphidocelis subcapitata]|uniref:Uncharacterized protein n=1 Tax=Raphidocelis subcapitata TaxID=307507 RepID=A0A2V0PL96_9CHLO|nr:hypothetical protein Rsub_13245 [Raphidocelis subcapitata]|eukprot:GBG00542.1 hypothetical protein Rsub_13245 [Raphidocelis subcapitata]
MAAASLHSGMRVLSPPSTSAAAAPGPAAWRPAPRGARAPPPPLPRPRGGAAAAHPPGGQPYRFKYTYSPIGGDGKGGPLPGDDPLGLPRSELAAPSRHAQQCDMSDTAADHWPPAEAGAVALPNPQAQRFRIRQAPIPVPISFPGSDYWHVDILRDYSKDWPSLRKTEDGWHFRPGFLSPIADPKLAPFFVYQGIEQVRYSIGDRAFQMLFAAVYTSLHAALFSLLWASDPSLALAVGLNWARGALSPAKFGLLFFLSLSGRVWLYWVFFAGALLDKLLARGAPPIRKFFWANFAVWLAYLAFAPLHWYPLPFPPFAPGAI